MSYKIDTTDAFDRKSEKLLKKLKTSFTEINDWEAGHTKLQNAKEAISEIEAELNNGL